MVALPDGEWMLEVAAAATSELHDELSLTSEVADGGCSVDAVVEAAAAVEEEGGGLLDEESKDESWLEFRLTARGEAGGRGCLRTTETMLWVCSQIRRNRRTLPENQDQKHLHKDSRKSENCFFTGNERKGDGMDEATIRSVADVADVDLHSHLPLEHSGRRSRSPLVIQAEG